MFGAHITNTYLKLSFIDPWRFVLYHTGMLYVWPYEGLGPVPFPFEPWAESGS